MLQVLMWVITGLVVGWMARTAMRSRSAGLLGDLTIGCLGAVFGGWLTRRLGITVPDGFMGAASAALLGATSLIGAYRVALRLQASVMPGGEAGAVASQALGAPVQRLVDIERRIAAALTSRPPLPHPNQVFEAQRTFGERVADQVAQFGGSWTFIGWFLTLMLVWMAINQESGRPFDPYPFILLNLILSCLAALQAPVIMMSQHRQSAKDRLDAQHDYEVNVRAELQILALHEKLDLARDQELRRILTLMDDQGARLAAIERHLVVDRR